MALQIRRGTNKERLQITPAQGELIYVTDYELKTISVTGITILDNVLSTTGDHGLLTGQKIRFQDTSKNGLILNRVYDVVKITDSTFSLTYSGVGVDITGTYTVPLIFAVGPTNAAGEPLGINVTALWIGDGNTIGGVPGNTQGLDDLTDVTITTPAEGNTLYYDATTKQWKNTSILNIDDVTGTQNIFVNGTGTSYITLADSYTNAPVAPLVVRHTSTGTTTSGFGTTIGFEAEAADGTIKTAGFLDYVSTDATSGSEDYSFGIGLMKNGTTPSSVQPRALSLTSTGDLTIQGNMYIASTNTENTTIDFIHPTKTGVVAWDGDSLNINDSIQVDGVGTSSIRADNTNTNLGYPVLNLFSKTTATPANDFGSVLSFSANNTAGTEKTLGFINFNYDDITTGSEDAEAVIGLMENGVNPNTPPGTVPAQLRVKSNGDVYVRNALYVGGDLIVNGTTTTINSTTMTVDDPNMVLNAVGTPSDANANGGGITVKGTTDKSLNWDNSTKRWWFTNGTGGSVDGNFPMVVDLTDIRNVETTSFVKGQMFYFDGTNWINGSNLTFNNNTYRPKITTQVNDAAINGAFNLVKDTGSTSFVDGTGTGHIMSVVSNSQAQVDVGRLHAEYDSNGAHDVSILTTTTNNSTYAELYRASKNRTSINNGKLYIDAVNGRIGINTITPNLSLEVQGNAYVSTTLEVIQDITARSNVNVGGETITMNYGYTGTPTQDVGLVVERGDSADTFWKWNETNDWWGTDDTIWASKWIIGGQGLATNGRQVILNNADATPASTDHALLTVQRGSGADVSLRWNETTDRWQTTSDGSTYITLPNQNLDTTDTPTFNNLNLNGTTLSLNHDAAGTPSDNVYMRVQRGSSPYAELVWDESIDRWRYGVNGVSYISMPNQALDTTSSVKFDTLNINDKTYLYGSSGDIRIGNDVYVGGDLLVFNEAYTGSTPTADAMIMVQRGSATDAYLKWNESTDWWDTSHSLKVGGDLTVQGNGYIYSSSNLALTLSGQDVNVAGSLTTGNNTTLGSDSSDTITMNGLVAGNIAFTYNDTATPRGVLGKTSTSADDFWFVGGAESSGTSDAGYLMLATGDNGTEPIYVRQYTGSPLSGTISKELTLLDSSGNTTLPGNLQINGNNIKRSDGATMVSFSGTDLTTFAGSIKLGGSTKSIYVDFNGDGVNENVLAFSSSSSIYGTSYLAKMNTNVNLGIGVSYVFIDNMVEINTSSITTTQNSSYAVLDYFDKAVYRSAKYVLQISNGTAHQMWEGMVIHDGTNIYMTAYGDLRTNGELAHMSVGLNATTGSPELRVQAVNATQTKFKATKTYIAV